MKGSWDGGMPAVGCLGQEGGRSRKKINRVRRGSAGWESGMHCSTQCGNTDSGFKKHLLKPDNRKGGTGVKGPSRAPQSKRCKKSEQRTVLLVRRL